MSSGITTQQMKSAPFGVYYVWPVRNSISYAKDLADFLGRSDLHITTADVLFDRYRLRARAASGQPLCYVLDHATNLKREHWESLAQFNEHRRKATPTAASKLLISREPRIESPQDERADLRIVKTPRLGEPDQYEVIELHGSSTGGPMLVRSIMPSFNEAMFAMLERYKDEIIENFHPWDGARADFTMRSRQRR